MPPKKKPKRKPINAKTKSTLQKRQIIQNTPMDNLPPYIEEDKEHTYHQVVSQLPWLLGLWGELILLLGVVILKIMT